MDQVPIDENLDIKKLTKQLKKQKRQEKKQKKAAKKKQEKQDAKRPQLQDELQQLDYEQMLTQQMDTGKIPYTNSIQEHVTENQQHIEHLHQPLNVENNLLNITGEGELYVQGKHIPSSKNHNVNRAAINHVLKDIYRDVGDEENSRKIKLFGSHNIDHEPLSTDENQQKLALHTKIMKEIVAKRKWNAEGDYMTFNHNGEELFIGYKSKYGGKRAKPPTVQDQVKQAIREQKDKVKPITEKVVELESENTVLRARRAKDDGPHSTMENRNEPVPDLEPVKSQVLDMNPVVEAVQEPSQEPYYLPLRQSPSILAIENLFKNDKTFTSQHHKKIFGPIFGENTIRGKIH